MKNLKNEFFKKGYVIVNFFSKKEILDLLAKVESYYLKLAKTKKVLIPNLKEYHKIEISEKIHKSLVHPNQRQIKIPNKIVKKILKNETIKSIKLQLYGNKKIIIVQEYQNILRSNFAGLRIVKPFSATSGVHCEKSSPGENWDPITLWFPLFGLNKNYSLNIAPYSHKQLHPKKEIIKDNRYLARAYNDKYLSNFKFFRPNLKIGQVIIFHPNLLHGGSICKGKYSRISAEVRIMREEHFIKRKNYFILPKKNKRKIRLSNKYIKKKYY